jgi:hypothetical protein
MGSLLVALAAAMPLVWLACEFQSRPWLRIMTGIGARVGVFWISELLSALNEFNANSYFGAANIQLIKSTINGLAKGHADVVLQELQTFSKTNV